MSRRDEKASDAARGGHPPASVLDFLYHDARRVASFLAQFDPSGYLTGLKQSENASEQEGEEATMQAAANAVVARATGTHLARRLSAGGEATERTYDPFWANALTFLDFLTERSLISRDLREAKIGQFVLVSGTMMIADVALLKAVWGNEKLKQSVLAGAVAGATSLATSQFGPLSDEQRQGIQNEAELMFELAPGLPHTLQARLVGETGRVWCGLADEALVGSSADVVLKHGAVLAGTWSILGILDAYPYNPHALADDGRPLIELVAEIAGTGAGQIALRLAHAARGLMGRPESYFGVTPLVIYRTIEGSP